MANLVKTVGAAIASEMAVSVVVSPDPDSVITYYQVGPFRLFPNGHIQILEGDIVPVAKFGIEPGSRRLDVTNFNSDVRDWLQANVGLRIEFHNNEPWRWMGPASAAGVPLYDGDGRYSRLWDDPPILADYLEERGYTLAKPLAALRSPGCECVQLKPTSFVKFCFCLFALKWGVSVGEYHNSLSRHIGKTGVPITAKFAEPDTCLADYNRFTHSPAGPDQELLELWR